jgi:hypothetical protein
VRAMLLLVLLLALIALFSFYEPLRPYWEERLPAVVKCLNEGRYSDAWAAATAGEPPGARSNFWKKSEPLGERPPVGARTDASTPASADTIAAPDTIAR